MDVTKVVESLNADIWGVWFLAGAALVFWMQAGFAMVEAGLMFEFIFMEILRQQ